MDALTAKDILLTGVNLIVAISTLVLAFATWKMAKVTQKTLEAQSRPCVVMYLERGADAPEVIELVVENVGTVPAANIHFELPDYFPWNAGGLVPGDENKPENLTEGPLRKGMKFLVPGAPWRTYWGQFGGLMDGLEEKSVEVTIRFTYADGRPAEPTVNILDARDFETCSWTDSYSKKQTDALQKQAKSLEGIRDSVRKIVAASQQ